MYLLTERKPAPSTCIYKINAIRFFYREILGLDKASVPVPPSKATISLPDILSDQEVERLFSVTCQIKYRVMFMTAYGGGLRASVLRYLKVADIQSDRMMIHVRSGNRDSIAAC